MRPGKAFLLLSFTVTLVSACAICPPIDPKIKLVMELDNYLIPLAKAVDVLIDKLPPDARDQEIFLAAAERSGDPGLLKPFDCYVLKAQIEDGSGVILVCSKDGKEGIIEDVTCTTRPDTYRPSGSPYTYLLDVKRVYILT